jgi:flagellar biosynthesis chaperone FliJ
VKRFHWPLQRVLDITEQRERVLRAELFALARAIVRIRQEIMWRRAMVRTILAELAERDLRERLPEQTVVLECSAAEQRIIRHLESRQSELSKQREARTEQFLRTRGRRQTLERLRDEARQQHVRQEQRREQKQFDETAHLAFSRGHR